ncbi:Uncharacterized membrane protein YeiH [Poseidonocella pacifica]|uniref:Uncharacterized membrane protein YeiH n=1 Tax=Poseidonocella pacifica TaxID=871651 RepID=A0A1I0XCH5_9RHOB|nr:trimeric intracellular cation channel family protein [Poseidonocella pacifica]SFA98584.1 Uncharacterized membrane protein YeiH [Poseidonocella pacifica]
MGPAILLDYLGVALFAATGALVASRQQLDIVGFIFLAMLTGMGGGTLRDLILGVPVFWVKQPAFVLVCAGAAVLTFFSAHLLESRYRWVLWLDAAALAAYCVYGAYKGLAVTGSPVVAAVMGMMTAALGGVMRDIVAGEPSVLLRKEIYMLAALVGAASYVLADAAGLRPLHAILAGYAAAFGMRSGALIFGWTLPAYHSRPGREAEASLEAARKKRAARRRRRQ